LIFLSMFYAGLGFHIWHNRVEFASCVVSRPVNFYTAFAVKQNF
jgi:hypothetical protein